MFRSPAAGQREEKDSGAVMTHVRRWWRRGRLVWSEPRRPPWLKVNPRATGIDDELQPGETTMGMEAREFLAEPEPGELGEDGQAAG
jgi:hypothetical protein